MTTALSAHAKGTRLAIHVLPRAKQTQLAGEHGGAIKLRVQAPPVGGAANEAVIAFLADLMAIPRSRVVIVAGHGSRRKLVELVGVALEHAALRLGHP